MSARVGECIYEGFGKLNIYLLDGISKVSIFFCLSLVKDSRIALARTSVHSLLSPGKYGFGPACLSFVVSTFRGNSGNLPLLVYNTLGRQVGICCLLPLFLGGLAQVMLGSLII